MPERAEGAGASIADPVIRRRALRARILSAGILVPLALAAVTFGAPYFEAFLTLAAVLMAREWARMTKGAALARTGVLLAIAAGSMVLVAATGLDVPTLLAAGFGAALMLYVYARIRHVHAALWYAAGALAIGLPCAAFVWLRNDLPGGLLTTYWALAVVWAADTGAFAAGRAIGGPKLAPKISPNKTWAGLLGAVLAATGASGIAGWLLGAHDAATLMPLGGAVALVAQAGDLAESFLKRHFGVKDTGGLIPGHGGLLDRADSLLAVIPMVAIMSWLGDGLLIWK